MPPEHARGYVDYCANVLKGNARLTLNEKREVLEEIAKFANGVSVRC